MLILHELFAENFFELLCHDGYYFKKVANDTVIGLRKNRRIGISIDGNNNLRSSHSC